MTAKEKAEKIIPLLKKEHPNARIALRFASPFELLVATILSAQCTDERVNNVTADLFKKYTKPEDYMNVPQEELEKDIHSTGFYKQKAKSIRNCCVALIEKHDGKVPDDMKLLEALPGVGKKTASVLLGNAFDIPAIAVDTHVKRLSNRIGLAQSTNPDKIEIELREVLKKNDWVIFSHLLAHHGRKICKARKPNCLSCVISKWCDYFHSEANVIK